MALTVTAVAIDVPRQYDRFVNAPNVTSGTSTDPRARLGDPSANGRVAQWRVAYEQFERTPLRSEGE